MRKYSVGILRERLAQALDEADRGLPVIIERRGVRYVLKAEPRGPSRRGQPPVIETVDPAIEDGQWSWGWSSSGLQLKTRRHR